MDAGPKDSLTDTTGLLYISFLVLPNGGFAACVFPICEFLNDIPQCTCNSVKQDRKKTNCICIRDGCIVSDFHPLLMVKIAKKKINSGLMCVVSYRREGEKNPRSLMYQFLSTHL